MADVVFRTKIESVPTKPLAEVKGGASTPITDTVEVPYTDYAQEHNHPYLVDHFKLGDNWDVFSKEVDTIEEYAKSKIRSGEVANSVTAIKDLIKGMEKFNNLKDEERSTVKLEVLSNYAEFLMKNEQVKSNLRRYSNA